MGQRFAERREQEVLEDYRKKYPGLRPTYYGAQAYDAAQPHQQRGGSGRWRHFQEDAMKPRWRRLISSRVRGRSNMQQPHPIQNFYLQDVVKDADGQLALKTVATIVKDSQDPFHDKCPMK